MDYEKKYKEALERAEALIDGETNTSDALFYLNDIISIFPELKENNVDEWIEKIRKDIISYLNNRQILTIAESSAAEMWIAWLEKQGEQKSIFDFNANNWYVSKVDGKIHSIYNSVVEPKFHEGDWVVNNTTLNLCQILKVEHGQYICSDCSFPITKENNYHLWTIQDAEDGDVLWHSDSASNGIFIFKEIRHDGKVLCYCDYDSEDHFCNGEYHTCCWSNDKYIKPATKEQRDHLFEKMHKAGYVWDEEKKELKKIEQSELTEFEDAVKYMMNSYRDAIGDNDVTTEEVKKHATYLLSLIPHKSAEWSEEDERFFNDVDFTLFQYKDMPKERYWKIIEWLKSIKQRMEE